MPIEFTSYSGGYRIFVFSLFGGLPYSDSTIAKQLQFKELTIVCKHTVSASQAVQILISMIISIYNFCLDLPMNIHSKNKINYSITL